MVRFLGWYIGNSMLQRLMTLQLAAIISDSTAFHKAIAKQKFYDRIKT